jgi:hypothetical protein
MDRKALLYLVLLLVAVAAVAYFVSPSREGFTPNPSPSIIPDSAIQHGQERFNKLVDLVNLTNPQVQLSTNSQREMNQATQSIQVDVANAAGLPGIFVARKPTDPYKIPSTPPAGIETAQTVCEPIATPDCSAFNDPTFAANCGISFDIKGSDSKGKPHMGGLYISPEDRAAQKQRAIALGSSPDNIRYMPTIGIAAKGTFAIDASSCTVISEQTACKRTQTLTSPNCTTCFTSGDYNRVDPSTPRIPPTFVIQTNATGVVFVDATGNQTTLTVAADTPTPVSPPSTIAEGSTFQWNLTGTNNGSLYFCGYLTAPTTKGTFNLDLNALLERDLVTNYKPRIGGGQAVNNVQCTVLRPGIGQSTMQLQGFMPFSFLTPFEYDAQTCDNGPIVTQPASATFLGNDGCYASGAKPGNYSLACLQQLFLGAGGTALGQGYPANTTTANALLYDSTGTARSLDDINTFLYQMNVKASTGVDTQGNQLSLADWNAASMFCTGTAVTNPCEGPNKTGGPLTTECIQYLYTNGGAADPTIGPTYSLGSSYASQDSNGNPVYCTPNGALSPSTPEGLKRAQAAGGVAGIKALYNNAHTTANNNSLTNADRQQSMEDCYGAQFNAKGNEVFWVGGPGTPPNAYTIAAADASAVCGQFGATVATPAQIADAQASGAQWCACGWASDGTAVFPMQQSGVSGCGQAGVNNCGSLTAAGVNCYGPKPSSIGIPANYTINPFSQGQWNNPFLP